MADVLIVNFPTADAPSRSDMAAVGFGRAMAERLGGVCDVLVVGPHAGMAAAALSRCGVRAVLVADHPDLAAPTGEARASAVAAVAKARPYRLIAAANSTITRDSFPRLAARLAAPMATDVVAIGALTDKSLVFTKPAFSGNLLTEIELTGPTVVATCRASAFDAPTVGNVAAEIQSVELPHRLAHPRKEFVELNKTPLERPELTEADVVVSGGRGTRGPEGFKVLEQLADVLGAAIGASRAAVDAGWMPNDFQVGQTGKVIAPKLYIGCGISGAIQHLAGMRNSKTIVVINKDASAPLFEIADYGLVADLFEAVPALVAAIRAARK